MLTNVRALAASLAPEEAVERLEALHASASNALRDALERYLSTGSAPTPEERARFRYPELRLDYRPTGPLPAIKRAYAKFQGRGAYATTVTQPGVLPALPPGAASSARRRLRSDDRRRRQPAGDALPLRVRARRRARARASLRGGARPPLSRPRSSPPSATRSRTGPGSRRTASRARSPSSTRCASTTRCGASSTTPAPTGGRSSPGSCSPTITATSTSSCAGRSSSSRPDGPFDETRPARRHRHRPASTTPEEAAARAASLALASFPDAGL